MIHKLLKDTKVVLASASPRRQDLLKMLGLSPLIIPSRILEQVTNQPAHLQVIKNAQNKAKSVAKMLDKQSLVIGADTIVVLDRQVLGKPADKQEAKAFLRKLSGNTHKVYTGLCLCLNMTCECAYERSVVEFSELTDMEIDDYIDTLEPADKAGAYGIQGYGSQFIKRINGCYFNVMGFPIHLFYNMLKKIYSSDDATNIG